MMNKRSIMCNGYADIWLGELWDSGKRDGGRIVHKDFVDSRPIPQFPNTKEGHIAMALDWNYSFPDMVFHVEDIIVEGDTLVGRYMAQGIHTQSFLGIEGSGKEVTLTGIDIMKFHQDKIIKWWHNEDIHSFMEQLKQFEEN